MANTGLSSGIRWSSFSVIGREVSRAIFTVVLANLLGPYDFGIVAQATVYIGIVGLLLDQGFSSALIQQPQIEPRVPGAVVTINLAVGAVLTAVTIAIAPVWAAFMRTPALVLVLVVLAPCLLIRAAATTPRAMLLRDMEFRTIGIADIGAAVFGGVLGVVIAVAGGSYWAVVAQIVFTDLVFLLVLCGFGAIWKPNFHLRLLRSIAAFSGRAFAAGLLITAVSRNIDNLLVGRYQGATALSYYSLGYRLLLLPVQLIGATVGRVLFPVFARLAHDLVAARVEMERATRALAAITIPTMAFASATAPQLVGILFGSAWGRAIPIIQVLAIAGALQTIYQPSTGPLMLGLGRAKLTLRYAWLTTAIVTIGIVAGLPFGPLGVAVGYTVATAILVPVEWLIRRRLLGMPIRGQITMLTPASHIAVWVTLAYVLIAKVIPGHNLLVLVVGTAVAGCTGIAVLRFAHRSSWNELAHMSARVMGRRGRLQSGHSDNGDSSAPPTL